MKRLTFLIFFSLILFMVPRLGHAGLSFDIGLTSFANVMDTLYRPIGGQINVGWSLRDDKVIINFISGGVISPSITGQATDPVGHIASGVLFSIIDSVYAGFRVGMLISQPGTDDLLSYGSVVLRYQKHRKGANFFMETEVSFTGIYNAVSMGVNFNL